MSNIQRAQNQKIQEKSLLVSLIIHIPYPPGDSNTRYAKHSTIYEFIHHYPSAAGQLERTGQVLWLKTYVNIQS